MDEELKLLLSIRDFSDSPEFVRVITSFIENKLKEHPTEETLRNILKTFPMKININSDLAEDFIIVDMLEYRKNKQHTSILSTITLNIVNNSAQKDPPINTHVTVPLMWCFSTIIDEVKW